MHLKAESDVEIPSSDTSAYCQARARLPEKLLEKLFNSSSQNLEARVTTENLWYGRNVKVIDGSTISMPDTVENQKEYPQHSSQQPGCGFPIAKIGVIFSLATGAAVAFCIDILNTHDIKLARKLYKEIHVYLLAYNLLRSLMWQAGTTYNTPPNRLSLQGTRHHLLNFIPKLETAHSQKRFSLYRSLLKIIVHKVVPDRPGRSEPRVTKRRPKAYPRLTKPRHELRHQLQTA
ncbi:hypothetical protein [Nostoc sp. 'Peltigera membranacea cyanobiont' 213]|uniref:hypothetical protein n=1 Tax=Nostoc sp. 'Peltigera membranacea cyanobiont' 213 TaxID=2014530 RepID=UPI001CB9C4B9|nr:hypothetical protein [Nostoc sp. 'Peltigera membranacea cyanobiont' 213]